MSPCTNTRLTKRYQHVETLNLSRSLRPPMTTRVKDHYIRFRHLRQQKDSLQHPTSRVCACYSYTLSATIYVVGVKHTGYGLNSDKGEFGSMMSLSFFFVQMTASYASCHAYRLALRGQSSRSPAETSVIIMIMPDPSQ